MTTVGPKEWLHVRPSHLPEETWVPHFDAHPEAGGRPSVDRENEVHLPVLVDTVSCAKKCEVAEQRRAIVMMGIPASGKSSSLTDTLTGDWVKVDPDAIKERIPEYQEAVGLRYIHAARMAHEESAYVAKRVRMLALKTNRNVVIDGVGSDAEKMDTLIKLLRRSGYHVHLRMVHLPLDVAIRRASYRAEQTGRLVPEEFIRSVAPKVPRVFWSLSKQVQSARLVDSMRQPPFAAWELLEDRQEVVHDAVFVSNFVKEFQLT